MGKIIGITFEPKEVAKFVCEICAKEYKTQEGLENHIKDKHSDIEDSE